MKQQKDLDKLRHSAAHLLGAAVEALYPKAKRAIGPAIETGFYYDFDFGKLKLSDSDLPKIEKKMREIIKTWDSFVKRELSFDEAVAHHRDNPYKLELIEEFSGKDHSPLSFYQSGNFLDLCRGGHIDSPKDTLKHFKLLSVAGAYWRGSEQNPMLTRIYGTAFFAQEDLDNHLLALAKAEDNDHRKLGLKLGLFTFSDLVGSGLPLYTPKGALVRRLINEHVESIQAKSGYTQVWTPQIGKADLFKTSGHYHKYKDDMFEVKSHYSDEEFYLKPMNCPHHALIYTSEPRSYRDLPLRLTDFAMLYRDEKPGEISGLARVRAFSQDDCHIFCREDQVDEEIDRALSMIKEVMDVYGFTYRYRLSVRDPKTPDKYLGDPQTWDKVEKWAEVIMNRNKIEHFTAPGEASFYAPKMDLMAKDALGREWQLSTIQIDYVQPERFGLEYTSENGSRVRPVMIHRAIVGSSERFMMVILEHFGGALPLWLSPTQIHLITVSENELTYAKDCLSRLKEAGIRADLDDTDRSLGKKLALSRNFRHPYVAIIGKKEVETNSLTLKNRREEQVTLSLDETLVKLTEEINAKSR